MRGDIPLIGTITRFSSARYDRTLYTSAGIRYRAGMEQLVTGAETARLLGLSPTRVMTLIREGRLPARKVGRQWVLRLEDVERFRDTPRPAGRPRKPAPDRP